MKKLDFLILFFIKRLNWGKIGSGMVFSVIERLAVNECFQKEIFNAPGWA